MPSHYAEKKARDDILKYVNDFYAHRVANVKYVKSDREALQANMGWQQLYQHLNLLFQHVDVYRNDRVLMGLLASDSSARVHDRAIDLWKSMWSLHQPGMTAIPALDLPLGGYSKAQVLSEIPPSLLDLTWHCQQPILTSKKIKNRTVSVTSNECKVCVKCLAMEFARKQNELSECTRDSLESSIFQYHTLQGIDATTTLVNSRADRSFLPDRVKVEEIQVSSIKKKPKSAKG